MGQRRTGINPLAYMGVEAITPPQLVIEKRNPTVNDVQGYNLGTIWDYTYTNSDDVVIPTIWMLVAANEGVATWVQLYPAVNVGALTFNTDAGNAIPAAGIIRIVGSTNTNTSGAGNIVTVNLNNNVDITGPLTVSGIGAGVVSSSAGGVFSASEGTNGQVLIGSTGNIPAWANITAGANVTVTNGPNTITIASTGGGGGGTTGFLTGDALTSTPNAGTVTFANGSNIYTTSPGSSHTFVANLVNSPSVSGNVTAGTGFIATTVGFTATAGNLVLPVTSADETSGEITFGGNRFISNYGEFNAFIGQGSGNATLTSATARYNSSLGFSTLAGLTTGSNNTAFGDTSLSAATTGSFNTGLADNALVSLTTGNYNTAAGYNAGSNYTGAESSNVLLSHLGLLGESNVIRLGTEGAGNGQQQDAYIAGVYAPHTAINATHKIMAVDLNGKLGGLTNGTDGQVLIGSSAGAPAWGSLTAGANITLTAGNNTLTIASTGGVAGGITQVITGVGPFPVGQVPGGTATELLANTSINLLASAPLYTSATNHTATVSLTDGANGQLLIGGGGAGAIWASLTSDGSVTITPGVNSISLSTAGGGGGLTQLNSVVNGHANGAGGVVNVVGNPVGGAPFVAGQNIYISGDNAHTLTIATNNSINLPATTSDLAGVYLINGLRVAHIYGTGNSFFGSVAGNFSLTGTNNTGIGSGSAGSGYVLQKLTTGTSNVAIGYSSSSDLTTGSANVSIGGLSLEHATTGAYNTCVGQNSLAGITTGQFNIAVGDGAGYNLTTSNSNNILIGSGGTIGWNNIIQIGATATTVGVVATYGGNTACHIGGIIPLATAGVGPKALVQVDNTDRLTTLAPVAGTIPMYNSVNTLIAGTLASLDGSVVITPTTTGVNLAAPAGAGQYAFLYVQQTNAPNCTGMTLSTVISPSPVYPYILGSNVGLTPIFDKAAAAQFAGTIYTAPKTGVYSITVSVNFNTLLGPIPWQNLFVSCSLVSVGMQVLTDANPANVKNYGICNTSSPGFGGFIINQDQQTVQWTGLVPMSAGATAQFFGVMAVDAATANNVKFTPFGIGPAPILGYGLPYLLLSGNAIINTSTSISGFFISA